MTKRARLARFAIAGLVVGALQFTARPASAEPFYEGFDNVSTLGANGWALINNSTPAGGTNWFQGNTGIFDAYSGAPDSYIASNYLAANGDGNISNWLLLPELTLSDGDTFTFYTRSGGFYPDNLELRFSANGASTNVGGTDSSVGDFTTLLRVINPALDSSYPTDWTAYSVTLSGLGAGTSGRLAFRYFVPNTGAPNGDYIGIDDVVITPEPTSITLLGLGLAGLVGRRRLARKGA